MLLVHDTLRRMRVGGINGHIAWVTDGWTTPTGPTDPTSRSAILDVARAAVSAIDSPFLTGMKRPKKGEDPVIRRFRCNAQGLPEPVTVAPLSDASGDLLTLIVRLSNRWPEVAAYIEAERARLELPLIGPGLANAHLDSP